MKKRKGGEYACDAKDHLPRPSHAEWAPTILFLFSLFLVGKKYKKNGLSQDAAARHTGAPCYAVRLCKGFRHIDRDGACGAAVSPKEAAVPTERGGCGPVR